MNAPVRIYSAIEEHSLHFYLLHRPDGSPIGHEKTCKKEGRPVPDDEITGDDVHAEAQPAAGDEPIDLMAALRASIERSQGGRRSRSGSRSASLESMSKHELEERTRRANVPGRSRMSKDGLVRTLRQAA